MRTHKISLALSTLTLVLVAFAGFFLSVTAAHALTQRQAEQIIEEALEECYEEFDENSEECESGDYIVEFEENTVGSFGSGLYDAEVIYDGDGEPCGYERDRNGDYIIYDTIPEEDCGEDVDSGLCGAGQS